MDIRDIQNKLDEINGTIREIKDSANSAHNSISLNRELISLLMEEIMHEYIPAPTATDLLSNISVDINATINGETVTLRGTFAPVTQAHEVPAPVEENMTAEEKLMKAVTGRDVIEALGGE